MTSFFRDPESFETLGRFLPDVLNRMGDGEVFRVWVPGCSTGEEAYSLAIVLREALESSGKRISLQVFGTDIDGSAVDKARKGAYPAGLAGDVEPGRLKRFFLMEGGRLCGA